MVFRICFPPFRVMIGGYFFVSCVFVCESLSHSFGEIDDI